MKFVKQTLAAGVIAAATFALPAQADLITFDPTGTAGATGDLSGVALFEAVRQRRALRVVRG